MTRKKRFSVTIMFQTRWMTIYAKNKKEAKKLLYEKLKKIPSFKFLKKDSTDISEF